MWFLLRFLLPPAHLLYAWAAAALMAAFVAREVRRRWRLYFGVAGPAKAQSPRFWRCLWRRPTELPSNIRPGEIGWVEGKSYYRPSDKSPAYECDAQTMQRVIVSPDGLTTTTVTYTLRSPPVPVRAEGRTVNPLCPATAVPKGTGVLGAMGSGLYPVEVASFTATDVGLLMAAHCIETIHAASRSNDLYVSTKLDPQGLRLWKKVPEHLFGTTSVRVRFNGYRSQEDTMTSRDLALVTVPEAFHSFAGVQILRRLRFSTSLTGQLVANSPIHENPNAPAAHGYSDGEYSYPPDEWRDTGVGYHTASTLPGSSGAMLWGPGNNPLAVGVHLGAADGGNWFVNGPTVQGFLRARQDARLLSSVYATIGKRAATFLHPEAGSVASLDSPPEGGNARPGHVEADSDDDMDLGRAAAFTRDRTGHHNDPMEMINHFNAIHAARAAADAAFAVRHRRRGTPVPEMKVSGEEVPEPPRAAAPLQAIPEVLEDDACAVRDAVAYLLGKPFVARQDALAAIRETTSQEFYSSVCQCLKAQAGADGFSAEVRSVPKSFGPSAAQAYRDARAPPPEPPIQPNAWRDMHARPSAESRSPLQMLVAGILGAPGLTESNPPTPPAAPQEAAASPAAKAGSAPQAGPPPSRRRSRKPHGRKPKDLYGPKPADKAAHPLPSWALEPRVARAATSHSESKEFTKVTTTKPKLVPHSRRLPGADGVGAVSAASCRWTLENPLPACEPDVAALVTEAVAEAVRTDDYSVLLPAAQALRKAPPCDITALPVFDALRARRSVYVPTTDAAPFDHLTPVFKVGKPIQVEGEPGRELDPEEVARYVRLGGKLDADGLPGHALPDRTNKGKLDSLKFQLNRKSECLPTKPWNMARLYEYAESWPKATPAAEHIGKTSHRWRSVIQHLKLDKSPAASSLEFTGADKADMIDKNPLLLEVAWVRIAALLLFDPAVLDECSPALLLRMGMRDPALLFVKGELHKRSKVASRCWRAIWDISLADELVQRFLHDATNKIDIDTYQAGGALSEEHPLFGSTSGMGHHDAGCEQTVALMRRLLGVSGKLASADASGWDITVTRMHKLAAAYIRAAQHGWSPGKVGVPDLLLRALLGQAILSTAHCVLIGRTVYQVDLLGIQASGESSTSGDNNRSRGAQVFCLTGAPNMTQGDDLVTSQPLTAEDVKAFRDQGTLISEYTELEPGAPVAFTSHFYDLETGRVTFGNWPKMAARLALTSELDRLRQDPGVAAGIRGCLRHTPDVAAVFEGYLREHNIQVPEPDPHFNLRHLCY